MGAGDQLGQTAQVEDLDTENQTRQTAKEDQAEQMVWCRVVLQLRLIGVEQQRVYYMRGGEGSTVLD